MTPSPRTVAIVTLVDYDTMSNDHDRIAYYAPPGGRLAIIYKRINRSSTLWALLRDTCTMRCTKREEGNLDLIAVDPPFNYFAGLRVNAESASQGEPRSALRLRLIRLLSPLAVLRDLSFTPSLALAAVRKLGGDCDVCIGVGPWGAATALLLRAIGKTRLVVYRDRDDEAHLVPSRVRQWYTGAVEEATMRRSDLVICSGELLAERRRQQIGRTVELIPNGVDWKRFAPARAQSADDRTLVYVGNVVPWNGLEHAIRALAIVRTQLPGTRLRIIGGGQQGYLAHLRRVIAECAVDDAVELSGPRPSEDIPGLLGGAAIALAITDPATSRRFASPLKLVEYMAAGVPALGTVGTETQRIIERCGCGLVVPYDVDAVAGSVLALLGDPVRRLVMRESGIKHSAGLEWQVLVGREMELVRQYYGALSNDRGDRKEGSSSAKATSSHRQP